MCSRSIHYQTHFSFDLVIFIITIFYIIFLLISLNKTLRIRSDLYLFLGTLTYPLYLIHQNIGMILFNDLHKYVNPYVLLAIMPFLMIFVAYQVHINVEKRLAPNVLKLLLEKY